MICLHHPRTLKLGRLSLMGEESHLFQSVFGKIFVIVAAVFCLFFVFGVSHSCDQGLVQSLYSGISPSIF